MKVCTVIGFPLGATFPEVKAFEAQRCANLGATELDMVINIGALKSRHYDLVQDDIAAVVDAAHPLGASVKVIIEAAYLTDEEKVEPACSPRRRARITSRRPPDSHQPVLPWRTSRSCGESWAPAWA